MKNILCLNKIAPAGTALLAKDKYNCTDTTNEPHGILVRSASMHEYAFSESLQAIARAGAGVNNIPLDACTEAGVAVFNTPGANARGVCELVICGLFLSSRDVVGGVEWAKGLSSDVAKTVEKGKSQFGGCEIWGKTLGVLGLGAIGALVVESAHALGMKVVGYDPYLSEAKREVLSPICEIASSLEEVYAKSDYLTIHIPCTAESRGMIGNTAFAEMKDGVKILNFSRAELVNIEELASAVESGKVSKYVTDFPTEELSGIPSVVAIPHLGASTEESEDRCAEMAVLQLCDYIENGNVKNSVNFPNVTLQREEGKMRLCVLSDASVTSAELSAKVCGNVTAMASGTRGKVTYTILEGDELSLKDTDGVIKSYCK